MNFRDNFFSIPIDNFKDRYGLIFVLSSMQDATVNYQYPELAGETLRLELDFTFLQEHVIEIIVLGERMPSVAVDRFVVVGKKI